MLFLDCLPLGVRYQKKIKENHTNGRPWRNLSILYICRSSHTNYGRLLCILPIHRWFKHKPQQRM